MIKKLKQLRTNWRKLQARYLYEPLAEIIYRKRKTDREFKIGYLMGDMLDAYCISKKHLFVWCRL